MNKQDPNLDRTGNVNISPESVQPLGDFVLVRRLLNEDKIGSIFLLTGKNNDKRELWRGVVVACGLGDALLNLECANCESQKQMVAQVAKERGFGKCDICGFTELKLRSQDSRVAMNVKVGDEILFARAPANDIDFNGAAHVFLHEEQHIYAVIEKEAA